MNLLSVKKGQNKFRGDMTPIKLLILLSYPREILITNRGGCLK